MSPPLDRSTPPAAGAPRPFELPAFERRRLANGLEVRLAPTHHLPLLDLQIVLPAGAVHQPPDAAGLAGFTAAVLDEGTERRDSEEIAATVERLGGYLGTAAGWETMRIHCALLAPHLDTGLELVAEVARRPSFPAAETERLGAQLRAEIERRRTQPSALAGDALIAALYPDSVYGRPRIGTAESLAGLDRDDLAGYYRRHAAASSAHLILVGDFGPEAAGDRLDELFSDWRTPEPVAAPLPAATSRDGVEIVVVDRAGAQTELRLGHAGPPRDTTDYFPLVVLNSLLGGKFTSRINLNLRERHGYTYGASSWFDWRRGPGPFVISAAVDTEHAAAAAREVVTELERLRAEPVTAGELDETRSYLVGVFPYTSQRLADLGARLRHLAVFGLPDDYYATWPQRVAAVGAGDVQRAARHHLHPDRLVIVAVGPAAELEPGLRGLGPVRVVEPGA